MADLKAIFKTYDVRGLVPAELDDSITRLIGSAFAAEVAGHARQVVVGHDMRDSSPGLARAFSDGVRDAGLDVVMIGLASTDQLYFASGHFRLPGAVITASHNPAAYNGLKLCRSGAVAMSRDTGLSAIQDRVERHELASARTAQPAEGRLTYVDVSPDYVAHLLRLAPVSGRRLKVAVDAGNGMAGHTVPPLFARLDVELVPLYFELDGSFPHHEANPLDPANLHDLQTTVISSGADLGLAFDGDADRCFAVDENGDAVSPSALTALIAARALAVEPGAHVIHNLITSRAVPETIERHGGVPVRTRVGHSLIKATMAEVNAIFGGEHSGHFYFRDFWYADSGLLAALHLLAAAAESDLPVSELVAGFSPYAPSGELNFEVADPRAVIDELAACYAGDDSVDLDRLDGLTVSSQRWWFNVRASNTEPLLRLNVEATTFDLMVEIRERALTQIRRVS
ncbi:MAG: phosphomannomutase/phosphoglucomutase [Nocardioidaceae bacterium]